MMLPLNQPIRRLRLCLPHGTLSLNNFTAPLAANFLFSHLSSLIVLAGWSRQNAHYHDRAPGKWA